MTPFSQKQPFGINDLAIQGHSVRQTWATDEPANEDEVRKPLRSNFQPVPIAHVPLTGDPLLVRLGEELDYARRMIDATGDVLTSDPITLGRHGLSLQALDKVGQMLTHIANVIRSSDPGAAVDQVCMGDLRARLQRSRAL